MASESVATERSAEMRGVSYAEFSPGWRADILLVKAAAIAHVLCQAAHGGEAECEMMSRAAWALEDMLVEAKDLLAQDHEDRCKKAKEAHA